jgi:tetratricopeptide (TPR) repeat protein
MRATYSFALAIVSIALLAGPCFADGVPLLDGHVLQGQVSDVTAEGLTLKRVSSSGGTITMKMSADHIAPQWWYARRDAALGNQTKARLELSVWAVEHGLFQQAKAQFEKARKLDGKAASEFQDKVVPGLRAGIAADLVQAARRTMDAGKLDVANKMVQAVITRFGDTHAAEDARHLKATLQHRMDKRLKTNAYWKKFGDDERGREQADQRSRVTDPIVALIRQGHNIMGHMPPMAAQADSVEHTRQAAVEYKKAIEKVNAALKAHAADKELVARLHKLGKQAQAGLVQSHVTAGDVYAETGNYSGALDQANRLEAVDPHGADAHALRARVDQSKDWEGDGIVASSRWVGRRAGRGGGRHR